MILYKYRFLLISIFILFSSTIFAEMNGRGQIFEILNENKTLSFVPVLEPKENELIKYGYIKIDNDTNEKIELKELPSIEEWAKLRYGLETSYELPVHSAQEENKGKQLTASSSSSPVTSSSSSSSVLGGSPIRSCNSASS